MRDFIPIYAFIVTGPSENCPRQIASLAKRPRDTENDLPGEIDGHQRGFVLLDRLATHSRSENRIRTDNYCST